jgi:putative ABC transport system permease protein
MESLIEDVKYALRALNRSRGFAIVAILTLALGIGANTAIFSIVNAVLLRPLPFAHPEQLVRLFDDLNGANAKDTGMSVPEFYDLRDRSGVFEDMSVVWPVSAALVGGDHPDRIELLATSPDYFRILGAHPAIGRVYGPEDAQEGFSDPIVISDGLWKRQFGGDPNVLGRHVRLDTDSYTIVGVMSPDFRHPEQTLDGEVEIWGAAGFTNDPFPHPPVRAFNFLPGAIGRLKPGVTVQQAQSQLDAFVQQLRETYPKDYPAASRWTVRLEPVQESLTGKIRPTLAVLLAAVGFVLLIACVNIASLLLARSSGRLRELAIRRALGASRARLIRQLLTESLVLSLLGGIAAMIVLALTRESLLALIPADLPRLTEVHLDARVIGTAFFLSIATGLIFGMAPALQSASTDPNRDLKEGSRTGGRSARRNRFQGALVCGEIALSLVLLTGAGLLVRSFWNMLSVNPGFQPDRLSVAQIWIPVPNNPKMNPYLKTTDRAQFVRNAIRELQPIPGVKQVALGGNVGLPFLGIRFELPFSVAGNSDARAEKLAAPVDNVTPSFFETLQIPLLRGRAFTDADTDTSERVAIVSEAFAKNFLATRDPLSTQIVVGTPPVNVRIVGVVGDMRSDGLDAPAPPEIYFPVYQGSGFAMAVYLRTDTNAAVPETAIAAAVHRVDSTLPVFGVRTMDQILAASMAHRRFALALMGIFAAMALFLAAMGIYGLMAYAVSQRTQELGLRIALGAQRRDIALLTLRPGMFLTLLGLAIGLVGAAILTRWMAALLFDVSPVDALTFAGVPVILAIVALAACYIPARRAMRVDPMEALRYE